MLKDINSKEIERNFTSSFMLSLLLAFTIALAACSLSANAHMGLTPEEAIIGKSEIVSLYVGHDCGDDTVGTTNFTIGLPKGLQSVNVELTGNWHVFIHKKTVDPPADLGWGLVDEYVSAVTYIGFLPDGFYQLFNLRIGMPMAPGKKLWFKGYQDCHNQGTSIAWDQIPNSTNTHPMYPARSITLLNYTGMDMGHEEHEEH